MSVIMTFYKLRTLTILLFLQNENSAKEVWTNFNVMSQFLVSKLTCEIAGIGVMKR